MSTDSVLNLLLCYNVGVASRLVGSIVLRIFIHDLHGVGFLALVEEFSQIVEPFCLFRLQLARGANDVYLLWKLVDRDQGHDLVGDALSDDEEARSTTHCLGDGALGSPKKKKKVNYEARR